MTSAWKAMAQGMTMTNTSATSVLPQTVVAGIKHEKLREACKRCRKKALQLQQQGLDFALHDHNIAGLPLFLCQAPLDQTSLTYMYVVTCMTLHVQHFMCDTVCMRL